MEKPPAEDGSDTSTIVAAGTPPDEITRAPASEPVGEAVGPPAPAVPETADAKEALAIALPNTTTEDRASQDTAPETASETTETTTEPSSQPPIAPRICGVCHTQPGKYKCPRCPISYCSVPCNKAHKATHPDPVPQSQPSTSFQPATGTKRPYPTPEPFRPLLDNAASLKRLFAKYPNLEAELLRIHRATLPPPDVIEGSSSLPKKLLPHHLGGGAQQQVPWTRQVGLRKGVAALRKARVDPGEDGDGVREYCGLVVHLLDADRVRREDGVDAVGLVRGEVVDEERGVIRRLIDTEMGDGD